MKRQIKLPKPYVKTLDGYIIKKFLGTYVFAIVLILAIIVMFDINEKLDSFMKAPVKATIFEYYLNYIPYMANQFSPLFTFIAVIFSRRRWLRTPRLSPSCRAASVSDGCCCLIWRRHWLLPASRLCLTLMSSRPPM